MALLQFKNLSFKYELANSLALDNLNFEIDEGEFVVLLGPTGSGKSTLLKMIKREIRPYGRLGGEILYEHNNINTLNDYQAASLVGYVMQNPNNQIVTEKVYSELAFGLENLGINENEMRLRVGEMANFFGINEWFKSSTNDLSGGQKQILNLASVMVMQPKILLLDEPTSQLDPIAARDFINILQRLNQELGITIIIVEHRLEEVLALADRLIVMDNGRIIADEHPQVVSQQLINHPMNLALPSAVRIYQALKINTELPITVREGRKFLSDNFKNEIKGLNILEPKLPEDYIIELKNVYQRYYREQFDIIHGLSLKIGRGEIFSLVGGNGSGKTTLLKIIAGLIRPYRGRVLINNKNINGYKGGSLYLNNLVFLPQNPEDIFTEQTVKEDLEQIDSIYQQGDFQTHFEEIVTTLNINNILDKHPYDLSGGEQQKAALAKILLLQPKIILFDEPTKGLDGFTKNQFKSMLEKLQDQGITIVIVTHDIEFAARVSSRCGMLFDGSILTVDHPRNFFSSHNFYTTAANRISRHMYDRAITEEDVIKLALMNGRKYETS